ncbi:at-rich interactive domain-containing protein 4 [Nicotiana attenuata]|uniref:At-rich interactive domain-containing protein 4 n=1 Tax=Nicotiana attenuata TaxID=49451 RepID=A0A314L690_NICAT|nr:at-rich interactive domain-containing protein 4 [Nicotiana attenuata]
MSVACGTKVFEVCLKVPTWASASQEEFLKDVMQFLILRGHSRLVPQCGLAEFPDVILNGKLLNLFNLYREGWFSCWHWHHLERTSFLKDAKSHAQLNPMAYIPVEDFGVAISQNATRSWCERHYMTTVGYQYVSVSCVAYSVCDVVSAKLARQAEAVCNASPVELQFLSQRRRSMTVLIERV